MIVGDHPPVVVGIGIGADPEKLRQRTGESHHETAAEAGPGSRLSDRRLGSMAPVVPALRGQLSAFDRQHPGATQPELVGDPADLFGRNVFIGSRVRRRQARIVLLGGQQITRAEVPGRIRSRHGTQAGATIASSPGSSTTSSTVTVFCRGARATVTDQRHPSYPARVQANRCVVTLAASDTEPRWAPISLPSTCSTRTARAISTAASPIASGLGAFVLTLTSVITAPILPSAAPVVSLGYRSDIEPPIAGVCGKAAREIGGGQEVARVGRSLLRVALPAQSPRRARQDRDMEPERRDEDAVSPSPSRVRAAGNRAGRATRAAGRGAGRAARGTFTLARRVSHAEGAGESGLSRIIELHAFNAAGDAAIAISLAGTLFFQVPGGDDQARGQVALFLLLTMLPFAVVAPLIGPFLDRFSHGRRWAIGATMAIRGVMCWILASAVADESLLLFPAALGALVASKAYGVTRAAAVPRVAPPELGLVRANSRISLAGITGAAISAPIAVGVSMIGAQWSLRYAFLVFAGGTILAILLPCGRQHRR